MPFTSSDYKHDICFVAPNAFGLLSGRDDLRHIGGAEVQQCLIARELVRRGRRVCFVTHDHGQPDGAVYDRIRVFKMCGRADGLPFIRFVHPRWTSLCNAMRRADAEVYYQRTAGVETGQVAMWCGRHDRRMIAAIANDRDCTPELLARLNRRERSLYLYGLRRADAVVAQTGRQQALLREQFGVDTTIIRSCSEASASNSTLSTTARIGAKRALWIARFAPQKRLDSLIELANAAPDWSFDVIGGTVDDAVRHLNLETPNSLPANVTFHGVLPRERVSPFYDAATILVCTSDFEGFPNTMLESWARGLPVISTFDPDGLIASENLGRVAKLPHDLRKAMTKLIEHTGEWSECSFSARCYFMNHHTVEASADAYEDLLQCLTTAVES